MRHKDKRIRARKCCFSCIIRSVTFKYGNITENTTAKATNADYFAAQTENVPDSRSSALLDVDFSLQGCSVRDKSERKLNVPAGNR